MIWHCATRDCGRTAKSGRIVKGNTAQSISVELVFPADPPRAGAVSPTLVPVIRVEDLAVTIDREVLLPAVSFDLDAGDTLVLQGPNGSGKTTLLRVLAGLQRPSRGTATIAGEAISEQNAQFRSRVAAHIGIPPLARDLTLREHLELVAASWGKSAQEARSVALELLDELGITALAHRFPHEISSGQNQLFTLALTLARHFEVLLLDEPEQRLDANRLDVAIETLAARKSAGATLVLATHRPEIANALADKTLHLTP